MEFKITMFSKVLKHINQEDIYKFLKYFVIPYVLKTYNTVHEIEATMNNGIITFSFQNIQLPFSMVECK